VLAEGLVLSGISMSCAGSSRPSSGGDHEILHAVDALYPGTANHGELAGIGALFCFFLRQQYLGEDPGRARTVAECLARHKLPLVPSHIGLTDERFARAVVYAPDTRPGRYTILEHLGLDDNAALKAVGDYVDAYGR
jgi:glycerol-1-phosphate dehydrogenase [NAD(P)+]